MTIENVLTAAREMGRDPKVINKASCWLAWARAQMKGSLT